MWIFTDVLKSFVCILNLVFIFNLLYNIYSIKVAYWRGMRKAFNLYSQKRKNLYLKFPEKEMGNVEHDLRSMELNEFRNKGSPSFECRRLSIRTMSGKGSEQIFVPGM